MKHMHRAPFILLAAVLAGCTPPGDGPAGDPDAPKQRFAVAVEQQGRTVDIRNATARLASKPFTLVLAAPDPGAFFVNASTDPTSFNQAGQGLGYRQIAGFAGESYREGLFNRRKLLAVGRDVHHHWYYRGPNIHKFDAVKAVEGVTLMQRTVERLLVDGRRVDLRRFSGTLYLTIVMVDWNESLTARDEVEKHRLKLVFR